MACVPVIMGSPPLGIGGLYGTRAERMTDVYRADVDDFLGALPVEASAFR
jgi:hypothetical protein